MKEVLVTGGTGVLGRAVVRELLARKHNVRVLSRRASPTLPEGATAVTGDIAVPVGLAGALEGVDTVVHCATSPRSHAQADIDGTRNLVSAARSADGPHLIYVSIVGCDQIPYGYYRTKTVAELAIAESGLPWTVLRTTQFHDLIFAIAYATTKLPIVPVPRGVRDQPIDVNDVAPRLVELVESGAAGRTSDMGGPEVLGLEDIIRIVQRALGRERRIIRVPFAGKTYDGFRAGKHLAPDHLAGRRTFGEYVAEHVHKSADGKARADVPYRWRA